jgi:hypothetical protein
MAKANKTEAVTETKVVEVKPARVTLDLSQEEADVLASILGRFQGNGVPWSIFEALYDVTNRRTGESILVDGVPVEGNVTTVGQERAVW